MKFYRFEELLLNYFYNLNLFVLLQFHRDGKPIDLSWEYLKIFHVLNMKHIDPGFVELAP